MIGLKNPLRWLAMWRTHSACRVETLSTPGLEATLHRASRKSRRGTQSACATSRQYYAYKATVESLTDCFCVKDPLKALRLDSEESIGFPVSSDWISDAMSETSWSFKSPLIFSWKFSVGLACLVDLSTSLRGSGRPAFQLFQTAGVQRELDRISFRSTHLKRQRRVGGFGVQSKSRGGSFMVPLVRSCRIRRSWLQERRGYR